MYIVYCTIHIPTKNSTLSNSRSTFTLSGKLFGEDGLGPFKRMRYAEDSEITQRRRVSCFIVVL